jgi:hypothetical protein
LFITINLKRLFADFRILERVIQAGLITLASKAALEIHKQISKSTQSPATTGGVSGLKKVPGV